MAMSPFAALALPLVQNEGWQQSMKDFVEQMRSRARETVEAEGFKQWAQGLDRNITFMDWSYNLLGVDLTYVWDPELWVKFKDAVWHDSPQVFWNELADRIEYRESSHGICT